MGAIINCCKTVDQGKALLKFVDAISEKTLSTTVVMTAGEYIVPDPCVFLDYLSVPILSFFV